MKFKKYGCYTEIHGGKKEIHREKNKNSVYLLF